MGEQWKCTNCGNVEHIEREVICWECGKGEMVWEGCGGGKYAPKVMQTKPYDAT